MIIHVNRDEFELLREQWGEPTVNPDTGMPEFFSFGKVLKQAAGPIAGAALNYLAPGVGEAVGGALGISSSLGSALASGAVGAGVGALAGGRRGALYGGIAGAASPYLFGADGIGGDGGMVGNIFGGGLSALGGLGAASGAAPMGAGAAGAGAPPSGTGSITGGGGGLSGILKGGMGQNAKLGMTALSMLGALGGSTSDDKEAKKAAKAEREAQERFNAPLPVYQLARTPIQYAGAPDYTREGERSYYDRNNEYDTVAAAEGGSIAELMQMQMPERHEGYVTGEGDGRADEIDAKLSDGEYVITAEEVAMLGNGSNRAGADRLDEMRQLLRRHKGEALARGEQSEDALHPAQYLGVM